MSGIMMQLMAASSGVVTGQVAYTTPGTYSWVAPAGVTSVSVVCVGGGGGGSGVYGGGAAGGGGGLGYKNNYAVTPGTSYTVRVGEGGAGGTRGQYGNNGQDSYFVSTSVVYGGGPSSMQAGSYGGDGGGGGGYGTANFSGAYHGGGGAGGYSGKGGDGADPWSQDGLPGKDGAGGGGGGGGGYGGYTQGYVCGCCYITDQFYYSGGGGGVGLLGQGANGVGRPRASYLGGGGGSGGADGTGGIFGSNTYPSGSGGLYGGGGASWSFHAGTFYVTQIAGNGANGAVRIIWPGTTRQFPSTNTGNM